MRRLWAGLAMAIALGGGVVAISQVQSNGQAGNITCLVSNYNDWALAGTTGKGNDGSSKPNCTFGSTVTVNDLEWSCNQLLSNYGTLPIKVVQTWHPPFTDLAGGGAQISLDNGCQGDGNNDTIDLIAEVHGATGTSGDAGNGADACKTRQNPGPLNVQFTGNCDCGPPGPNAHPDEMQIQHTGDRNIWMVNVTSGDYDNGIPYCQGAGGIIYTSGAGLHIVGGKHIQCNHALNGTQADAGENHSVENAKFRTGLGPNWSLGDSGLTNVHTNCINQVDGQPYSNNGACINTSNFSPYSGNSCQRRVSGVWTEGA